MKKICWTPNRILATGFALLVLAGSALLCLPLASRSGEAIPFLSALFTATSATCVTGLALFDTWTQFSAFGQVVILTLIQIGGLGFMTAVMAILFLTDSHIGLRQRSLLAESIGLNRLAGIVRVARRILCGTALFEGLGAVLLATRFVPLFGLKRGIWFAVFHSVSAFCNAGFDLLGVMSPSSSLTYFYDDPVVVLTIAALILIGGIGFIVWTDIMEFHREKRELRLHTKLVLIMTALLTILGTAAMLLLEWDSAFKGMSAGDKLLNAFFHAVTPRTAGFNTVDFGTMTDAGKAVTMLLMYIGAAPGGTGGGVKVTTFAVVVLSVCASLKMKEDTSVGKFRLDSHTVTRAYMAFMVFLGLIVIGTLVLCIDGVDFLSAAFECVSAIATVGLSLGVTSSLHTASKIVIILLMYAGRVGGLTVFLAMNRRTSSAKLKNAVGKVIVG